MFNSIEIPDSDDDMPEPTTEMAKSITSGSETTEKHRETSNTPKMQSFEPSSSNATGISQSSSNPSQTKAQVRHRSRKTQHTVRNAAENEIQFETIPMDEVVRNSNPPPTEHQVIDNDNLKSAINNLLESEEVQGIIQRIANERVRCNFLLATYQMADINFSLNTNPDMLRNQFRERLKKRKEKGVAATSTTTSNPAQ